MIKRLGKLFSKETGDNAKRVNWKQMTSIEDVKSIDTSDDLLLVFKHSTRCGISSFALRRFENNTLETKHKVSYYFLDVLKFRDLSNEIAEKYDVRHESPQLLVFENGKLKKHLSHGEISAFSLNDYANN